MTPNDSHFEFAFEALALGFDVICDKPMTNTLARSHATAPARARHRFGVLPDTQLHRLPHGAPSQGDGGCG